MVGRYVLCFCGGVVTLLLGMAAGLGVILFWKRRMCAPAPRPMRKSDYYPEENAPRGVHVGRWNG